MTHRRTSWIVLLFAAACSSKKPPPAAPAPMAPTEAAPSTMQASAPEPAPAPAPPAGPDRSAVNGILDQIETHLTKASKAKGHDMTEHANAIAKLVAELDVHLATYSAGEAAYGKLKEHSKKLQDAAKKGHHKDGGSHHSDVEAAVKELRATL